MFVLGLLIGIYAYSIFIIGIINFLGIWQLFSVTTLFLLSVAYFAYKYLKRLKFKKLEIDSKSRFLMILILVLVFVNLLGVLGPELAFDALWYHLTIPKIFIQNESIFFIDGGLFYYSVMPKLIDLLYIPSIVFSSETGAKFTHFLFGIGTSIVIYLISRKFFDLKLSLLAVIVFL